MIVLVTGKPGVGKSTLIDNFIESYRPNKWVVTKGIPRPDGLRAGFEAFRHDGVRRVISHKTDIDSDVIVGENHVDLEAVDAMFADALSHVSTEYLTVVDEIGPIQMLSARFAAELASAFASGGDLLASIHYKDETLAPYRDYPGTLRLEVTPTNRDALPSVLQRLFAHKALFAPFSDVQIKLVGKLLNDFLETSQTIQIDKLLDHTLDYVASGKVTTGSEIFGYKVSGNHGVHKVISDGMSEQCDCDLYLGRGQYASHPGICSHILAVRLFLA